MPTALPGNGVQSDNDSPLILSSDAVRQLVSMSDAIACVAEAFQSSSRGEFVQPPRLALPDGSSLVMVAKKQVPEGTVVKVVTIQPQNRLHGLPTLHATVLWIDDATGKLTAVLEGSALTALRTGAATGAATQLLAATQARVLAMIGAGAQAPDQIRAVMAVRKIEEVRIASRTLKSAQALAAAMSSAAHSTTFTAVNTVREAVDDADVICCATTSTSPLLTSRDIGPRVHINAIGAYRADMAELSPDLLQSATTIAVDQVEATLAEAGDVIQALRQGSIRLADLVELGALLSNPPTTPPSGCTVFKSVGIAAQDWAVTRYAVSQFAQLA
jgi:ornithine cyclodeaminase